VAFETHKNVLRKVSTVFEDLISGDCEIQKISLNDISDENIKLLRRLIYMCPEKRFRKFRQHDDRNSRYLINSILLVTKYDVMFMEDLLKDRLESQRYSIAFAGQIWEQLKCQHLNDLADIVFKSCFTTENMVHWDPEPLTRVPIQIVKELTKNCKSIGQRKNSNKNKMKIWMQGIINYLRQAQRHRRASDNNLEHLQNLIAAQLQNSNNFTQFEVIEIMKPFLRFSFIRF
jgi:hypothetical protein